MFFSVKYNGKEFLMSEDLLNKLNNKYFKVAPKVYNKCKTCITEISWDHLFKELENLVDFNRVKNGSKFDSMFIDRYFKTFGITYDVAQESYHVWIIPRFDIIGFDLEKFERDFMEA